MPTAVVTERVPALALESVPLLVPLTVRLSPVTSPTNVAVPLKASTLVPLYARLLPERPVTVRGAGLMVTSASVGWVTL